MPPSPALWQAYAIGDAAARDQLLTQHLGLVHHLARRMARTLAVKADLDELVSAGSMGLMNALDAFDASRGHAFSTFAAPRIRGAILDELRRQDHVPRSIRRRMRDMAHARESLAHAAGRAPTETEVAEHLGVDRETLWRWQADVEATHHVALDHDGGEREGQRASLAPIAVLADDSEESIEDRLSHGQEVDILRDAILALKEQHRVVLSLYYFEELKLHEIATILGLTESRVSQIRSKALGCLRERIGTLRVGAA